MDIEKKLSELKKKFLNGENPTDLMNEMESCFKIPMINDEEYNSKNIDVIELYRTISNSRGL